MGAYCTLNPRVRSAKTGELVDSKLFSDLKRAVGYNNARSVYFKVREPEFVEEYGDILATDENGEFLLSSLKKVKSLSPFLGLKVRRSTAASEVDAYKPVVATRENILDAETRSMEYNSKVGNEFIAIPEVYEDNSGTEIVRIELVQDTLDNREKASQIVRKQVLVSRLSGLLSRLGVEDGVVDMEMDLLRKSGMSEYQAAVAFADGIRQVVDKANGDADTVTLSSELAQMVYVSMWDEPLVGRLISGIQTSGLAGVILNENEFNSIAHQTDNDPFSLAEAAAVKMIASYILNNSPEDLKSDPDLGSLSRIMERVNNKFIELYSSVNPEELDAYINEAKRTYYAQGQPEYERGEEVVLHSEEIEQETKELSPKVKKQRKLLHDLIETSVRRYKILSARSVDYDKDFDKNITASMYSRWQEEEYELGVYDFVEATLDQLEVANARMRELSENDNMPLETKATILKNIKDFIKSYQISLDAIKQAEYRGVIRPNRQMDETISQASDIIGKLMSDYEEKKNPLLISFVKRFVGEGLEAPFGLYDKDGKKKVFTAESLLEMAEKDITVFDRWLDSMAESGDILLRILDNTAKQARNNARMRTIEYKKRLDGAYLKLKKSGITDTSFMFERDPNGHKTGKYIDKEKAESLDPARKKYYKEVMAIKEELDALLPKGATKTYNIVRVRKDYIERVLSQSSLNGVLKETKEALKDKVKRRSDNPDAAGMETGEEEKSVLIDFSGRQVEMLPIMFVNSKDGESLDDLSEDVTSTMLLYANMATNYDSMNKVVGLLELLREKISERPVQQTAGGKALVNVLTAFGIPVKTKLTKSGEATNLVNRMNDWFSSQVYGKYMRDEGEILGMDVGMLANLSNEITALNQFALNILSGISNVMTASAMNRIESICGQYFSVKDLAKADKLFWQQIPDFLGDVGNPIKSSKLALFMEKFNAMQDFESSLREQDYAKSRFSHLMTTNSLYVINNAGELWIQNRAALALSESYGLYYKDKEGNHIPISLWDAQEVKTDENGVSRLVTKPGIYKADGTLWDDKKDVFKFTTKAKSLNQRMNGIYNYEDRNAAQSYAIGRMALMFRKWIKPSINRRYAGVNYNFDVDEWEEGFYRTTGRFLLQLVKDLKRGQLDIVTSYKNLDPREKANLTRFAVEVGQFISVVAAFAILKSVKDEDKDKGGELAHSWWFNQLLYQTRRLETEIGSQMIINPQMIQEAVNILKSPAACVSTWEGALNMTKLLIPSNYTTTLQTGRYKGHTKAYKLFWDSPIIPMHRTVYRGLHPENSLQFYDI